MAPIKGSPAGHVLLLHFSEREFVLFEFWKIGSLNGIIGTCFLVILICILSEAVDVIRQYLAKQHVPCDESTYVEHGTIIKYIKTTVTSYRAQQACLYGIQAILNYMMILIVITFNVWLILCVAIGKALGHFFFAGSPAVERILVMQDSPSPRRRSDVFNTVTSSPNHANMSQLSTLPKSSFA